MDLFNSKVLCLCVQWKFVAAYRQAQRREFAFSLVNAGMKVALRSGSNIVESLSIFYGGVGATLIKPTQTCQRLVGSERILTEGLFCEQQCFRLCL